MLGLSIATMICILISFPYGTSHRTPVNQRDEDETLLIKGHKCTGYSLTFNFEKKVVFQMKMTQTTKILCCISPYAAIIITTITIIIVIMVTVSSLSLS